jgi:hypothetical protein
MGRRLVAAACSPYGDLGLSNSARLVLVAMAVMARDDGDPPTYYGGWAYLSRPLGHAEYTPAAHRAVARAVAELRKSGLIVVIGEARPGSNVNYGLRL